MTKYRVKTPDGEVHLVSALTYVIDSIGLTFVAENRNVALFRTYDWFKIVTDETEQDSAATSTDSEAASGEVVTPAASGE